MLWCSAFHEIGKHCPSCDKALRANVLFARKENVIGADEGGVGIEKLVADGLAVQALLQVGEASGCAIGACRAADEQFAVDDAGEVGGFEYIGKGAGNLVAAAGVKTFDAAYIGKLYADPVPLPFGREIPGVERVEIALTDGIGEHDRVEDRRRRKLGLLRLAQEPAEERQIGR
ncbi:hypothetical protein D9M72_324330 [compost metagenome]